MDEELCCCALWFFESDSILPEDFWCTWCWLLNDEPEVPPSLTLWLPFSTCWLIVRAVEFTVLKLWLRFAGA